MLRTVRCPPYELSLHSPNLNQLYSDWLPIRPQEMIEFRNTLVDKLVHVFAIVLYFFVNLLIGPRTVSWLAGHPTLEEIGKGELEELKSQNKPIPNNFNEIIESDYVQNGCLRWFHEVKDRNPSDPVLLFLHGGGYATPCTPNHSKLLSLIFLNLPASHRLSIVWLDYTLSVDAPFPKQITEASSAYNVLSKTSNNILLMGDSAGSNLCINLMRHIKRTLPGVPPIAEPKIRPSGAVLISPWVELQVDKTKLSPTSSYKKYSYFRDTLTVSAVNEFGKLVLKDFKDPQLNKEYKDTYLDTSTDWKNVLPPAVKTLVTYGEHEVLRDSIEAWVANTSLEQRGASIVVDPRGLHSSPTTLAPEYSYLTPQIINFLKATLPTKE